MSCLLPTQLLLKPLGRNREVVKTTCMLSMQKKLDPHIQAKRAVLHKYKDSPTAQAQEALKVSRAYVQTALRLCINQYWLDSCSSSQIASDTGNIKAMYHDIKKATDRNIKKMASLKSTTGEFISDKAKQMDGWRSLAEPVSHLCTPYTANAAYDGLDTYVGWRKAAFQKTCCMANWPQGRETKVVPNFFTKTSASGI